MLAKVLKFSFLATAPPLSCNGPSRILGLYVVVGERSNIRVVRAFSARMWTPWCAISVLLLALLAQSGLGLKLSNGK